MKRIYQTLLEEHFKTNRQMAFISGPRQVGKTTLVKYALPNARYFNYEKKSDTLIIRKGADAVASDLGLDKNPPDFSEVIFDELHKNPKWKSFLKGFFDVYGDGKLKIASTGSARMNIYKRGGDSLMGRYFPYRIHPLSVSEVASPKVDIENVFQIPKEIPKGTIEELLQFGGYPEPFIAKNMRFYNRWKSLRIEQLFSEDLRDFSKIQDIRGIRLLSELLTSSVGSGINYSSLANELDVSVNTIKSWIELLESVFFSYSIRPWYRNVASSIRKQPKIYLWDWSMVHDEGAKKENFIASHLLKAVHWWTDCGLGDFGLYYLRDKAQNEVDFLISKDSNPFLIIESKTSSREALSKALVGFSQKLNIPHAFQVCFDMPISKINPIEINTPTKISVLDLLKILP